MSDRWKGRLRISEVTYGNGTVKYVIEQYINSKDQWEMYETYDDLVSAQRNADFYYSQFIIESRVIIT